MIDGRRNARIYACQSRPSACHKKGVAPITVEHLFTLIMCPNPTQTSHLQPRWTRRTFPSLHRHLSTHQHRNRHRQSLPERAATRPQAACRSLQPQARWKNSKANTTMESPAARKAIASDTPTTGKPLLTGSPDKLQSKDYHGVSGCWRAQHTYDAADRSAWASWTTFKANSIVKS